MKALQQKDLDFLQASAVKRKEKKQSNGKLIALVVFPAVLLIAGVGSWGFLQWKNTSLEQKKAQYSETLNNLGSDDDYQRALALELQAGILNSNYKTASEMQEAFNSYPEFTKSFFDQLKTAAGNKISLLSYSYTASDGLLQLRGTAEGVSQTAVFVNALRNTGLFSALSYTGYTKEQAGQAGGAQPLYAFQIRGILKGRSAS